MSPAEWFAHPLCQAVTLALLHFLWQGMLIACGLAALVGLLGIRRPTARYACSLAALVLMIVCPLATVMWQTTISPRSLAMRVAQLSTPLEVASALSAGQSGSSTSLVAAAQPYVLAAWLAGVAIFGCRLLIGLVGLRQLRRDRLPLPPELASRVEQLGRRMGMRVRSLVFASRRVSEAMAVGLLQPLVLIPAAWATEMSPALLEAVIAHELAHLRRQDLWVNLLQRLVETLLFYHPAVWWLSRRLRIERELCCDELAVAATGQKLEYVAALEHVARRRGTRVEPALAAGIRGEKNMRLLERVRNVLGLSAGSERSLWPAGLLALALPLGAWMLATGLTPAEAAVVADDDDDDDEKEVRKKGQREREDGERKDEERGEKEIRKERERKEVRKEGQREAGERKEFRLDDDRPRKEAARDGDRPRKEGLRDGQIRKEGPRDGDKKPEKDIEAYVEELLTTVKKLSIENERLRAELAEIRGDKVRDTRIREGKVREGKVREREDARSLERKEVEAILDRKIKRSDDEFREAAERKEIEARDRKIKEADKKRDDRKDDDKDDDDR